MGTPTKLGPVNGLAELRAVVDALPDNGEGSAFDHASSTAWELHDAFRRASEGDGSLLDEYEPGMDFHDIQRDVLTTAARVACHYREWHLT